MKHSLILVLFFAIESARGLNGRESSLQSALKSFKARNLNEIQCLRQFEYLTRAFDNDELWAIEWFNSFGNVPSGVFSGHFESVGSYQQCVRARHSAVGSVGQLRGQHCMVYFRARAVQDENVNSSLALLTQLEWQNL